MTKKSRLAVVLLSVVTILVGGVGVSAPASAATYYCNYVEYKSSLKTWVPYHKGAATFNCYMNASHGTQGAAVKHLQDTLNECYGESLVEDGSFGLKTRDALVRAQRTSGADPDGRYGPQSRDKLSWVSYGNGMATPYCSRGWH